MQFIFFGWVYLDERRGTQAKEDTKGTHAGRAADEQYFCLAFFAARKIVRGSII